MTFQHENTLAGYARAAVDLKSWMVDYHRSPMAATYLRALIEGRISGQRNLPPEAGDDYPNAGTLDALSKITGNPWQYGEPFVLAPAMTAVVAAAAQTLDLTGEPVPDDLAPAEHGVLFLPEAIYERVDSDGTLAAIGALTWAQANTPEGRSWYVAAWSDRNDPLDPTAARHRAQLAETPELARQLGPYLLTGFTELPIGRPLDPDEYTAYHPDSADREWRSAPDGRYVLEHASMPTHPYAALAYAFWIIQAQPLATVAQPPLDRAARRRANRASIKHDTRVVMLRRTHAPAEPGGEAKWHYRVRFVVRGHWRRLTDRDGQPYRIWIHAHLKGPEDAPLLGGEKVAVLAR